MPTAKELGVTHTETGRLVRPSVPAQLNELGAKRIRGAVLALYDAVVEVNTGFPVRFYRGPNGAMVAVGFSGKDNKNYEVVIDIETDDYFLSPPANTTTK